jgi:hypothetical protein
MYIHREKRVAFLAHPRTASSATGYHLLQLGFELVKSHHHIDNEDLTSMYVVFGAVRDPFDVLVSWYFNQKREQSCFKEWLPVFMDGCSLMQGTLFPGLKYCSHLIYYESLQVDFNHVMETAELPQTTLTHRNVSKGRSGDYMRYYRDDKIRALVVDRFRQDFIDLDYPTTRTG